MDIQPTKPTDLVHFLVNACPSIEAEDFATHIHAYMQRLDKNFLK